MAIPDVVTHYHLADRRPFENLSDLDDDQLDAVVAGLMQARREGIQHRPFGHRYMELRRRTEARLRDSFVAAGGRPERQAPHYFVLGESAWYERLATNMSRVQVPLSALPPDQTSVTFPDSFVAMEMGSTVGLSYERKPYHGKVFRLPEVPALVERYGIPDPPWIDEHLDWTTWPEETYIEVQVWSDEPIRSHLGTGRRRQA